MAKAALRVNVNTPFAAISCLRGTTCGIIAASAGAKNTVTVEIRTLNSISKSRLTPARKSATDSAARNRLVATSTRRLSNRST